MSSASNKQCYEINVCKYIEKFSLTLHFANDQSMFLDVHLAMKTKTFKSYLHIDVIISTMMKTRHKWQLIN